MILSDKLTFGILFLVRMHIFTTQTVILLHKRTRQILTAPSHLPLRSHNFRLIKTANILTSGVPVTTILHMIFHNFQ